MESKGAKIVDSQQIFYDLQIWDLGLILLEINFISKDADYSLTSGLYFTISFW